jgi:shikimate kinase
MIRCPIFLIGMMGVGKSTLGREIALKTNSPFIDTDDWVTATWGRTPSWYFENLSETAFREKEAIALRTILKEGPAIIATGGGLPCHHENMALMNAVGHTIWLYESPEVIAQRLWNRKSKRPLIKGLSHQSALEDKITQLLQIRGPYYQTAQWHYSLQQLPVEKSVEALLGLLHNGCPEIFANP